MNFTKSQSVIILIGVAVVLFFILGLLGIIPVFKTPQDRKPVQEISLSIWGIDDKSFFEGVLDKFNQSNRNISISYRSFDEASYENALLNALATGQGPDIFMFHRSWLKKHGDKVAIPSATQISLPVFRQLFPDIAERDFVSDGKIYALPLYLDTVAMFYNKDIFNNKAIAVLPKTWDDFRLLIPYLTEYDVNHQIVKSAAAVGGSGKSISKVSDLLSALMIQSGSSIADSSRINNFDAPAVKAFDFYLQFANAGNAYYTWNDGLGNSLDSFSAAKTAVIFNYARSLADIKRKNPFLNFAVAHLPQFNPSQPKNYADYWGLAVSKQSLHPEEAWNFAIDLTTNANTNSMYLQSSGLPPALRTLINQYQNDANLSVFSRQALSAYAISYSDKNKFDSVISDMIEAVLTGKASQSDALDQARLKLAAGVQ